MSHQHSYYMSWKPDPFGMGENTFQLNWRQKFSNAFLTFALIGRVLRKLPQDQGTRILITPEWQGQSWFV